MADEAQAAQARAQVPTQTQAQAPPTSTSPHNEDPYEEELRQLQSQHVRHIETQCDVSHDEARAMYDRHAGNHVQAIVEYLSRGTTDDDTPNTVHKDHNVNHDVNHEVDRENPDTGDQPTTFEDLATQERYNVIRDIMTQKNTLLSYWMDEQQKAADGGGQSEPPVDDTESTGLQGTPPT